MNHPQQDKHRVNLILGDCLKKMKELEENSVDSIVTDPPYELGFMGKSWDNTGIANNKEMWAECLRVLKPGGYLLAFGGTRTYPRMASAIEDAGLEIRDMIEWVYGCLSEDTEILTANGWKMLYSVFEGDYVFACDYKNDMKLQLEPVKQKFIYDYDEDAYHIKDTGYYNSELMETDHIVSKNHNVLVSESWARDCFSNGEYPQKVAAEVLYKNVQKRKELGYKSDFHIPGLNGFIPCTIEKIPYKGKVWCVEVESGAFVARRNGKIFITGNSGFPKSLNIGVAVNKLETKEWSAIGKAIDNIDQKSIIEIWKSNSNNVKIVETQSLKLKEKAGCNTPSENFVQENVVENTNQIKLSLNVNTAEKHFIVLQAINTEENTALQNVEKIITEIKELQNLATTAGNSQPSDHAMQSMSIFTAQCDVKEWLSENTDVNHKVDEALKTLRGNKKYSNEEITNVLCVVLTNALKLTILNQSKTFQNLGTNQKMECVSAINVIITEYTAENLISNTVAILKSKVVDKLQGNEREVVGRYVAPDGKERGGVANNPMNISNYQKGDRGEHRLTKGTR